jgi:predicted amidophosphoribosyltransferase
MNVIDLDLPDFSDHPPPPRLTLAQYENWVLEIYAKSKYPKMSNEEMLAEWMRNEGSQTEEWPDFGVPVITISAVPRSAGEQ